MLSKTINTNTLSIENELTAGMLTEVLMYARDLTDCYPAFESWLNEKVIPGLANGDRSILVEYRRGELVAFAIVKDDGLEKKLCCLRVLPGYQDYGLGVRLFKRAFEELETEKPLLSVADERLVAFSKIFDYFNFKLEAKYINLYRTGQVEYSYNGLLYVPGPRIILQKEKMHTSHIVY